MDELATDLRHSLSDPEGQFVRRTEDEDLSDTRAITSRDREEIRRRTSAGAAGAAAAAAGTAPGSLSQATQGFQPVSAAAGAGTEGSAAAAGQNQAGNGAESFGNGVYAGDDEYPAADRDFADELEDEEIAQDERRLDRIIQILSVVAIVVIGIVIILVALNRRSSAGSTAENGAQQQETAAVNDDQTDQEKTEDDSPLIVLMPKVVGKTAEEAQDALKRANLTSEIVYGTSDVYEDGVVMDASAQEGERLEEGTKVKLTVARHETVTVTDVTGSKQSAAEETLRGQGLKTAVEQIFSEETEEGYVEKQSPEAGEKAAVGSTVTLYVSKGPDRTGMAEVPNILGMTEQEASAALLQVGLTPGETTVTDTSGRYEPGIVVGQSIAKGEYVEEGTKVDMELSGEPRYSYSARIEAPRYSEDPDYEEGTPVTLIIRTEDGKELLNTTTTDFPYQVSFTGIPYSSATLYLNYTNVVIEDSQTGETEGSEITERSIEMNLERELVFTKD